MYRKWAVLLTLILCIWPAYTTFDVLCYSGPKKNKMPINVAGIELEVELAVTPEEHAIGLMYRNKLEDKEGMLFVFPKEQILSFWMRNTPVPISIAFIKADGRIVQIDSMEPYSLDTHISREKVMYALEMRDGWFSAHKVKEGDSVKIPYINVNRKGVN